MGSNNEMTRKEFITLTFTLIGATAVGACSDDNNNNTGTGGVSGTGRGGTTGSAGTTGTGGNAGTSGGGTGGSGTAACADPLPAMQAPSDHVHTVTIPASTLDSTSAMTFDTSVALGHMHAVTLQPLQLATIKGGGSVMVTSTVASAHSHVFSVSCH